MTAIVKYFYEESASLEVLAPDTAPDARRAAGPLSLEAFLQAPRYYRGYLAGTDLATGRVGLTALPPAAYVPALADAFGVDGWYRLHGDDLAPGLDDLWRDPAGTRLLVQADDVPPLDLARAAAGPDRRTRLAALRPLLDGARLVAFPEPAHHGHDWSLFAAHPLRECLATAFRAHPAPGARRFVIPFREARSEEKFYFERYDLSRYAACEI